MIINYRQAVPMAKPYTRLTSIRTDGNQYIDTLFKPDSNTRVVMDVESLSTSTAAYFGSRSGKSYIFWCLGVTKVRSDFGSDQKQLDVSSTALRATIDKNKNLCYFNDTLISNTAAEFSCDGDLLLFTIMENDGEVDERKLSARLYSCQIYDNDVLVRDFIPIKDENDRIGLYDQVFGVFYENAGTGAFIAEA